MLANCINIYRQKLHSIQRAGKDLDGKILENLLRF